MYTQSSTTHSLWFASALVPSGWERDVRIDVNAGRIASVDVGVRPLEHDERHSIAIPAIANVHSHAFQRALAGHTEHRAGTDDFWSWREAMYELVAKLTPEHLEAIAAWAFIEMLECGIARVAEFHYVHHSEDGSPYTDIGELAGRMASAANTSGIGLTLLPVFYAHGGIGGLPPKPTQRRFVNSIDSFSRLLDASKRVVAALPFANVGVAAHSVRAVTPDELNTLCGLDPNVPFHIHVAEQTAEVEEFERWSGARPVDWLLDHFDVNERWCLIHATHVARHEIERIAASRASVGLCPITEANLGDGIFPTREFIHMNGRFGIGTDSNVSIDIAEELRLLDYAQRLHHRARNTLVTDNRRSSGRLLFDFASAGGAQATGVQTGSLAVGNIADIIALSNVHPSMANRSGDALLDSWIFAGAPSIDCVWSGGRKVVNHGRHVAREAVQSKYIETLRALRRS